MVDQVARQLNVSRETVYKYSDVRKPDARFRTVEYGGIHLWYPFGNAVILEDELA